jgi:hypothetical protein
MTECSLLGWLTLIALAATGGVVTWYTVETHWLRKEAQLQTELQNRPFLSLKRIGEIFYLTNAGRGLARNVRLADVIFDDSLQFREAPLITHLAPEEDEGLRWRVFGGQPSVNVPLGDVAIRELDLPEYCGRTLAHQPPNTEATVTIGYESMVGQKYRTTLKIRHGVAEIVADGRL